MAAVLLGPGGSAAPRPPAGFDAVVREFPDIRCELGVPAPPTAIALSVSAWRAPRFAFYEFDRALDGAVAEGPLELHVQGEADELPAASLEILTRCQRLLGRVNAESSGSTWARVRARHLGMHDLEKPLVRADYDHALDAWQWALRLEPKASLALQVAALCHDIERLASEPDERIEQRAPDYQAFKDAHAGAGATMAAALLDAAGVDETTRDRAVTLIAAHERPRGDVELELLNDADALSFFSLNSPGFLAYFGPEHARRKVAYTLRRMTPWARARLDGVRLCDAVRAMVREETSR
jgi:hypothetical protein